MIDATPADPLVLLVNDRNKPLRPTSASRAVTRYRDRIADRLSDPTLRLQDTRGTAATRLLRAGLGPNQIANHMGWSLRYVTAAIEHYAAVSPAESAEALDLLKREKQRREGKAVNAIVHFLEVLGQSLIWSGAAALVTTVLVRFLFRMFDRGFMFRRLFIACVSSGLVLFVPAQFAFAFEPPLRPSLLGRAPGRCARVDLDDLYHPDLLRRGVGALRF